MQGDQSVRQQLKFKLHNNMQEGEIHKRPSVNTRFIYFNTTKECSRVEEE